MRKKPIPQQKKKLKWLTVDNGSVIRVFHHPEKILSKKRTRSAYYKIMCGCCDESFKIYYNTEEYPLIPGGRKGSLADINHIEIGGVHGTIRNWREVLLPLLKFAKRSDGEWIDFHYLKFPKKGGE